jgi:glycerol-3-phosphate acyltransferase PlsY
MTDTLLIVFGFLAGSLPTGFLVARWLRGIDIRAVGSGNPGATNVFRSVGKVAGSITLAVDIVKGWFPVWLAQRHGAGELAPVIVGLAAVAGHTWTPFLRFRGGKGVATSAGVFAALLPAATAAAVVAFGVGLAVSRHVSVGSLAGAVALPAAAFWLHGARPGSWLALAVGALVVVKHVPNIRRLLRGEELTLAGPRPPGGA